MIHRDIKPANLLLSEDGQIKLSDFGIARLFGNTRLTSDGGVLGTAEYMAPEQADGRVVTDRCDQYSLGGVMYALLAGRPPFRAGTLLEMLQLQRYAEPEPVRRYAPGTPVELDQIIRQLLEKDPQRRFANALILGRAGINAAGVVAGRIGPARRFRGGRQRCLRAGAGDQSPGGHGWPDHSRCQDSASQSGAKDAETTGGRDRSDPHPHDRAYRIARRATPRTRKPPKRSPPIGSSKSKSTRASGSGTTRSGPSSARGKC